MKNSCVLGIVFSWMVTGLIASFPCSALSTDTDVVINEIHYHPSSDTEGEEYIELFNKGTARVNLGGWSFTGGIVYTFPNESEIPPNGFVLVARNKALVQTLAPGVPVFGDSSGILNNDGERIKLVNASGATVDSVKYGDTTPWPVSADGDGPSLERVSPAALSDHPGNWRSSVFLATGQWVYVQAFGMVKSPQLSFHLSGTGAVWIDDISLTQIGSTINRVRNGGMETAWDDTWTALGTHDASSRFTTTKARTGSNVLMIQSAQAGSNEDSDAVRHTLSSIGSGSLYQLSFWLRMADAQGELVVKAGGDDFALRQPLTTAGITPGRRNSVYADNLPPVVSSVLYTPRSPKPVDSVTVQAYIEDTDGVDTAVVEYMTGTNNRWGQFRSVEMNRDSGNSKAGTYQTVLPRQTDRTFVRFRIVAVDSKGGQNVYPSPTEARWTETYFHYADEEAATIPLVFLYDFGVTNERDTQFRGNTALVYRPPQGSDWTVFDHIIQTNRERGFGWNVYLLNGYELEDMSSINLIFEPEPRYVMAEWLSYNVHRAIGTLAGKVDQYRLIRNNNDLGYHLMFEQPNRHFLARNGINNEGNLYKMIYNFDHTPTRQNIVRQHEKKTNLSTGHDDVVEMIQSYFKMSGDQETAFIESNFAVDEMINYFVGSQLISDWDGYFNNHFIYHDTEETGLWYLIPWDKDKTWGDSDSRNLLPYYEVYDMPVLFGADGTNPSGTGNRTWWRPPGFISGKFLANKDIQKRYLKRLGEVAMYEFTPEKWIPIIDALEARLEPEVRHRAEITGQGATSLLRDFHNDIESFRRQVINRRKFIIQEVEKRIGPVSVSDWTLF